LQVEFHLFIVLESNFDHANNLKLLFVKSLKSKLSTLFIYWVKVVF